MPFDELRWIKDHYNVTLSFETHPHVFSFSILWNIFEREKCNNCFNPQSFRNILQGKDLSGISIATDSILNIYRKRYVHNGQLNNVFQTLKLRNSDFPDLVRSVLLGNANDLEYKVFCITIIISRFRNNLFHGLKELNEIFTQEHLFEKNNLYISKLIETL